MVSAEAPLLTNPSVQQSYTNATSVTIDASTTQADHDDGGSPTTTSYCCVCCCGRGGTPIRQQLRSIGRYFIGYRVWSRPFLLAVVVALPQSLQLWDPASTPAWLTFVACCLSLVPLGVLLEFAVQHLFGASRSLVLSVLSQIIFDGPINTLIFAAALSVSHGGDFLKYFTVGAVLCNALFVTGSSLIVGAAATRVPLFRRLAGRARGTGSVRVEIQEATSRSYGLLLLAAIVFLLPTLCSLRRDHIRTTSRATAFVMVLLYIAMAIFQKFTDREEPDYDAESDAESDHDVAVMFAPIACRNTEPQCTASEMQDDADTTQIVKDSALAEDTSVVGATLGAAFPSLLPTEANIDDTAPPEADTPYLEGVGVPMSLFLLCVIGLPLQLVSVLLLKTIRGAAAETGIPWQWLAAVPTVLASSAHTMSDAWLLSSRGRVDNALTNVASSSMQSLMLVLPIFIVAAWAIHGSHIDLDLPVMLGAVFILTSVVTANVMGRRHATWLEGVMLVALYAVVCAYIAVAVWLDDHSNASPLDLLL